MRVVFDTNIFVLSQLGDPALAIVEAAFTDEWKRPLDFFYSAAMLIEYTDILTKLTQNRYNIFLPADTQALITNIQRYGHHVHRPSTSPKTTQTPVPTTRTTAF